MHKLSTAFWFRKSKASNDKGTLYLYVIIDNKKRQDAECSTHIQLLKNDWDSKAQRVMESDPLHEHKNEQLTFLKKTITRIKERLEDEDDEVSATNVVQAFLLLKSNNKKDLSIPTLFKLFLTAQEERIKVEKLKPDTLGVYIQTEAKLLKFLQHRKSPHLSVQFFDVKRTQDFNQYLMGVECLEISTIAKTLTIFKKFLKFCVSENYLNKNLLEGFKIKRAKAKRPITLNLEELSMIENQTLPERLRKVADFFLMQCYTGLSYSDLERVIKDPAAFVTTDVTDNSQWIAQERLKTKILAQIPVIPQANKLLEKYGGWENLPLVTNAKTNEYLKEIGLYCQIAISLHTHTARKTFISTLLNRAKVYFLNAQGNSVEPMIIARMAGWNGLRELNTYAEVERDTIRKELGV